MTAQKRFTLRELQENNLQVGYRPCPMVFYGELGLVLVPVGDHEYELPKGWKLVDYHGYWLISPDE